MYTGDQEGAHGPLPREDGADGATCHGRNPGFQKQTKGP